MCAMCTDRINIVEDFGVGPYAISSKHHPTCLQRLPPRMFYTKKKKRTRHCRAKFLGKRKINFRTPNNSSPNFKNGWEIEILSLGPAQEVLGGWYILGGDVSNVDIIHDLYKDYYILYYV